jgi:hypothetical protein
LQKALDSVEKLGGHDQTLAAMLKDAVESTQQLRDLRDKLEREIGQKELRTPEKPAGHDQALATTLQEAMDSTQQLRNLRDKLECEIDEKERRMGECERDREKEATAGPSSTVKSTPTVTTRAVRPEYFLTGLADEIDLTGVEEDESGSLSC